MVLMARFQFRVKAIIKKKCTTSVATPGSGRSYSWEIFTSGKYSEWLTMFQSSNFTQSAAERTKSYCTSQTPRASVSTLNVKIHDKISKMHYS